MLQIKDTHKLFEFKDYFNSPTKAFSNLLDAFKVFSSKSLISNVYKEKSKGISYNVLLQMLILMPFLGAKNISRIFSIEYQVFYQGKKDCLYETMKNFGINWRLLLYNFAKKFIKKVKASNLPGSLSYFIADDSDMEKTSAQFEGISRVFNHVIHKHVFAYKVLTLGYSDGKSFTPLDFSLHNEKGKKKNFGLTRKQRKEQYQKKERVSSSNGAKRKQELRINKVNNLIKMVKRSVKHGIIADYLLTDAWFLSEKLIIQIRKIKNGAIHLVSMCRMDKRKYLFDGKIYTAKELLKHSKTNKRNIKRSKKYKVYYIEQTVDYKGIVLKLFFTRLTKRSKWRLIVTTNPKLSFGQMFDIYSNRWAIEVFFKECKQYLGLGKNQSLDFDSQIAATTITSIQYIILALYKRYDKYETIGGVFEKCKNQITEQILSEKIFVLLLQIIEIIVVKLKLDLNIEKTISIIIHEIEFESKIYAIFSTPIDKGGRKMVA